MTTSEFSLKTVRNFYNLSFTGLTVVHIPLKLFLKKLVCGVFLMYV